MSDSPRGPRIGIKGPLLFSAGLGAVAFVVVLFAASGGTRNGLRYDLAFSAFGIAFIACLVVAAMLSMSYKENAEHLGKGDGVNLRSEDRLKKHQTPAEAPAESTPETQSEGSEADTPEAKPSDLHTDDDGGAPAA